MCNTLKSLFLTALLVIASWASANDDTASGIVKYNEGAFHEARSLFLAQSENGDAYATFWLGVTQWETGERFEAGDTFFRAAEMGDPWAMYMLVPRDGNPCRYLGWPCDEAWKAKALAGWEALAEQGNAKAQFAITKVSQPWWEYIPFYRLFRYHELLETGMDQNTYGAYQKYMRKFGNRTQYDFDYIHRAAGKGRASFMAAIGYSKHPSIKGQELAWLQKSLDTGFPDTAKSLCIDYKLGWEDFPVDLEKAFYYSVVYEVLNKGRDECKVFTQESVTDEYGLIVSDSEGKSIKRDLISEERQQALRKEAKAYAETLTPNLFLDETTIELFVY
ncbi:hypothetical protein [Enterovibrio norvegicus]|uniref:Sel1 repeat family protein n=1 Tax=Enterovibrio norvegicus TaxID=188144 RepID=A0A2N7L3P8_9GAMM|nr:hypothetical protein [Enterovibrio norvegicus]PMN87958.1 hypothetical protein BCT23_24285 [Enterovibrio norvegicus]